MGQWEIWAMSTKKSYGGNTELEARASSGLQTLSHLPQTHADGRKIIMTNESQTIKKKEFKIFWQSAHCAPVLSQCCRPSRRRRRRRHTAARRVQRSV